MVLQGTVGCEVFGIVMLRVTFGIASTPWTSRMQEFVVAIAVV